MELPDKTQGSADDGLALGEIIARRTLTLEGSASGASTIVEVRLGRPWLMEEPDMYVCPYQIAGVGSEGVKVGIGSDEINAIQAAFVILDGELVALSRRVEETLNWLGQRDLGFPLGIGGVGVKRGWKAPKG